jgi:molybdopterin/thiamine biosynthesis adenylyltransferase/rhodanese-related sulfurtransferase
MEFVIPETPPDDESSDLRDEAPAWSQAESLRYARHFSLPEIGPAGQSRLREARVLIIGVGGLGSPAALYLAAAGVGTLGLVDSDRVDVSNLQRQILHGTGTVGRPKVESAVQRIQDLNPHVKVERFPERLTSANALGVLQDFDIIIDGSDNFPTRYLVNDACVLLSKTNIYGAISRFEGQASVFAGAHGPCYRCLFAEPPPPELVPNCEEAGVLGVLPGIIGSIQALEAIKWIVGVGTSLVGRLLLFNALSLRTRELKVRKDPDCPVCGEQPTVRKLIDYEAFCGAPSAVSVEEAELDAPGLRRLLDAGGGLQVVDVRQPHEWEICRLPSATLIPLGDLPRRMGELDPAVPVVVYCHTGVRSLMATRMLQAAGFDSVKNLAGGIEGWARTVDPGMARY